jgi:uncharacterized protein YqgC (DUF456 family)
MTTGLPDPVPEASPGPNVPVRTNRLAATALICGICGLIIPLMPSMAAIVMGGYALRQVRQTREYGAGMALAGVILGSIGFVLWVLLVLLVNYVAQQCSINGGC